MAVFNESNTCIQDCLKLTDGESNYSGRAVVSKAQPVNTGKRGLTTAFTKCLPSGQPGSARAIWSSGISGAVSHDRALLRSVENVLRGAFVASGCRAWSGDKARFGSRGLSLVTNHSGRPPLPWCHVRGG